MMSILIGTTILLVLYLHNVNIVVTQIKYCTPATAGQLSADHDAIGVVENGPLNFVVKILAYFDQVWTF